MKKTIQAAGVAAAAIGLAATGPLTRTAEAQETEEPKYRVISAADNIEIREYEPMIVAQASVSGQRERAMSQGFRIIADYIFGNNLSSQKVAMTSPVTQQISPDEAGEKIAMTSPVTQQAEGDLWQVRFIMPSEYTMDTLPTPANQAITLIEVPAKRFAAIRFSGMGNQRTVMSHQADLEAFMAVSDMAAAAAPTYAFYDGPWTPPQMRRNEVMIEIAGEF